MGCGGSKKQEDEGDTQTRSAPVKPKKRKILDDDDGPKEQSAAPPASFRGTLRGGASIQVKMTKAQQMVIDKRREEAEKEEKAKRKPGAAGKAAVKAAVKIGGAKDKDKGNEAGGFLAIAPKEGGPTRGSTPKGNRGAPVRTDGKAPGVTSPKGLSSPQNPLVATSVDNSGSFTQSMSSSGFGYQPMSFTSAELEGFSTLRMLGKGAFGSTYEAALKSCKIICVKVIEFGDMESDAGEMANLRNEIDLMKRFQHVNIVQYYGSSEDKVKKQMNIFMEYVTGGTLNSFMAKFEDKGVPIETCKEWTRQMLEGVGYLHDQGVVHRDIKGANVLMTLNGEVKLADFGCSKSIDDSVSKTRGCQTMVGTPYWMAPEVLKCEPYGTKSDVWSIGCTVVEMLTGKPAWPESENMWAAVYKIANSKGLPPNIPKNLPKTMMSFLERVFERNPVKRATCKELLNHPWMKGK